MDSIILRADAAFLALLFFCLRRVCAGAGAADVCDCNNSLLNYFVVLWSLVVVVVVVTAASWS